MSAAIWIQCVRCGYVFQLSEEREKATVELEVRLCPVDHVFLMAEKLARISLGVSIPRSPQDGGTRWT